MSDTQSEGRYAGLRQTAARAWKAVAAYASEPGCTGDPRWNTAVGRAVRILLALSGCVVTVGLWVSGAGREVIELGGRIFDDLAAGEEQRTAALVTVGMFALLTFWIRVAIPPRRRRVATGYPGCTAGAAASALVRAPGASTVSIDVAGHEAAHAVVAHTLGWRVLHVSAVPQVGSDGRCDLMPDSTKSTVDNAWIGLCAALAGRAEDGEHTTSWPGSMQDLRDAVAHASFLVTAGRSPAAYTGPLTITDLLTGARTVVRGALDAQRAAVDAVTAALLEHRDLDGARVAELIDGATRAAA